jgi:hypothetical protein
VPWQVLQTISAEAQPDPVKRIEIWSTVSATSLLVYTTKTKMPAVKQGSFPRRMTLLQQVSNPRLFRAWLGNARGQ